jgi:hypothetical protein
VEAAVDIPQLIQMLLVMHQTENLVEEEIQTQMKLLVLVVLGTIIKLLLLLHLDMVVLELDPQHQIN